MLYIRLKGRIFSARHPVHNLILILLILTIKSVNTHPTLDRLRRLTPYRAVSVSAAVLGLHRASAISLITLRLGPLKAGWLPRGSAIPTCTYVHILTYIFHAPYGEQCDQYPLSDSLHNDNLGRMSCLLSTPEVLPNPKRLGSKACSI